MLDLYDRIKNIPNTSTKQRFFEENNIAIHEPISIEKPNVFRATEESSGLPKMLKFITNKEEEIIQQLNSCEPPIPGLLLGKIIHLESTKVNERIALIMPRLSGDIAREPSSSPSVLLHQGKRIKEALESMHKLGLVHLDVKLENIFVDNNGTWFLSDFDFTCKTYDLIPEFHSSFYPLNKRKHIAVPQFDLYLLGVHLVIQLCCRDDLSIIQGDNGLPDEQRIVNVLKNFNHKDSNIDELKSFISQLLANFYVKCPGPCAQCDQLNY